MERSLELHDKADLVLLLPRLSRFARALTGSRHQADDLVQETLVRAFAAWSDAKRSVRAEGWMFRIMRNAWLDMQKAQRVRLRYADAIRAGSLLETGGEDAAIATLTLGAVEAALQSLPDEQRAALLLVCVEEFSYARAAEVLGIPVGTVMSRLARGRSALRQLLSDTAARDEPCTQQAGETVR